MIITVDYRYKIKVEENYRNLRSNIQLVANVDYKLGDSFAHHRLKVSLLYYVTDERLYEFMDGENDAYIDKEVRNMLYNEVLGKHREKTLREKNSKKIKEFNKHVSKYRRATFEYNDNKK